MITVERLREALSYEPETGVLRWKVRPGNRVKAGDEVGSLTYYGYLNFHLDGETLLVHRAAWALMTGEWPSGQIDHRDTDRVNNRWGNLRDVTPGVNSQNRKRPKPGKELPLGVTRRNGTYRASICARGVQRHLGVFESSEAASLAYQGAKQVLHATAVGA